VSSSKNLFPAIDTRDRDLNTRVFQNIGSCVKPAYHKNSLPTGFACIDDYAPEYIPDVNTDFPLSLTTSNVPSEHSSFAQSLLSPSVSSSSSQPLLSETQRVSSQCAPGNIPPILTPLDTQILEPLGGPDFDVLYNKMDSSFKSDMKNLLKKTSSIFGNKPIAPPLRGNKKDSIGVTMQENAVLSSACADTTRKLLELGQVDEAKEWTLLQMKLAATLRTDSSLIGVYERDRNMDHVLSVSNAAAVITPIMKEEFKIACANGVVPLI
jgi:hypothetical protein